MPCKPRDLLELARRLAAEGGADEATHRAAISRGYYAALHEVGATFPILNGAVREKGEGSHEFIIRRAVAYSQTGLPGSAQAAGVAAQLMRMRRVRNSADYRLDAPLERGAVGDTLARASRMLHLCSQIEQLRAEASTPL